MEILSRNNKYQRLNMLCYHFELSLKRFVKGNTNLLVESRKLVECISRLFYCKTFFVTRKLSILICWEKTAAIFANKKFKCRKTIQIDFYNFNDKNFQLSGIYYHCTKYVFLMKVIGSLFCLWFPPYFVVIVPYVDQVLNIS